MASFDLVLLNGTIHPGDSNHDKPVVRELAERLRADGGELGSMSGNSGLTDDFHKSNWTDQEVGFALGKDVLVLPVRLGSVSSLTGVVSRVCLAIGVPVPSQVARTIDVLF